jgi:drug/metabolite transporter (DMT)-like permease
MTANRSIFSRAPGRTRSGRHASYFIFPSATRTVGPARAGQAIPLMPLFGALLSAALLGERLHPYHFAGMALILAGIALSVLAGPAQEPAGAATGPELEDRA